MTIAELIEELRRYPPHLEVYHEHKADGDGLQRLASCGLFCDSDAGIDGSVSSTDRVIFEGNCVLLIGASPPMPPISGGHQSRRTRGRKPGPSTAL